jgi:hypothetical protein
MTIRCLLALLILEMALAVVILLGVMPLAHAETVGWRIKIQACTKAGRVMLGRERAEDKYTCQARAAHIAEFADLTKLLPAGARITARCLPVEGMPGA